MDLQVCTATYLGGEGRDDAVGVGVLPDGRVLVAGNFAGRAPADDAHRVLLGDGPARVLVFAADGRALEREVVLPGTLSAAALAPTGEPLLGLTGEGFGTGVLHPDEEALRWRVEGAEAGRVAVEGETGRVVTLSGRTVRVYDTEGTEELVHEVERTSVSDVAIGGTPVRAFATGFQQVSGNLQQPFLHAIELDGERAWTGWDWSAAEAGDLSSDTRGEVIAFGADGMLYYGGESHGGVTTHFRMPDDRDAEAPIRRFDDASRSHNWNGAAPLGFVARLDPATGEMRAATLLAVRLSNGRGNAVRPRFLAAREDGTLLVGGASACCIPHAEHRRVAGQPAMPDYAGGAFIQVLRPELNERPVFTIFGNGVRADVVGVAARGPGMAVIHNHGLRDDEETVTGSLITHEAERPAPSPGPSEAHLVVFPGP
ncbi:MAG: hypothetical protein EA398_04795 [Deltaproteobacteria bacterium]|nr:MAG: hypothetical protein EA398_04795 [Deltaproteobacteria bacterium]